MWIKKGAAKMERQIRYGKPCMTNLPPDLGVEIFKQIMNSPRPDREKMRAESARLVKVMLEDRKHEGCENAQ